MMVPPNMGPDYTTKFRKIFPELAKKNNATLIPFLLENVAYWAPGLFGTLILFVTFAYVLRTVGNASEMISIAR